MILSTVPFKSASPRQLHNTHPEALGSLTRKLQRVLEIIEHELRKDFESLIVFQQVDLGSLVMRLGALCLRDII